MNQFSQSGWVRQDFNFTLPPDQIAQHPAEPRDAARLLQVHSAERHDWHVRDLPTLLRPGDLLVTNNTRVIPARLFGRRGDARVEILLHQRIAEGRWRVFAKPAKRLRIDDCLIFADGFTAHLACKEADGQVTLDFGCDDTTLMSRLQQHGIMPLPPYIRRSPTGHDADRHAYQTLFATHDGAVAAPTAGLHFTPDLLARLQAMDVQRVDVTLHVGGGTFLPVRADKLVDHVMHAEWGMVTPAAAARINAVRAAGGRIIAVGTTALRVMETALDAQGQVRAWQGETQLFLYPGQPVNSADMLLTNFHLPQSTLFMLVCAFAGMPAMQQAYRHAIAMGYRFYSYGDACLLHRSPYDGLRR